MKKGSWKKERTTGRKYSHSDAHKKPKAHSRKKVYVSAYKRRKKKMGETFRKAPKKR